MTCIRAGAAIVCTRGRPRPPRPPKPQCRHPGCDRNATQAGYACRSHWFKLPQDLRTRLFRAAAAIPGRPHGIAWEACGEEADARFADQAARAAASAYVQPGLPL